MGLVAQAERLYRQAADADPRNSIAVVGLARVALERSDDVTAWRQAKRALAIDSENAAAQRMIERLEEVWRYRGQPLPEPNEVVSLADAEVEPERPTEPKRVSEPERIAEPEATPEPIVEQVAEPEAEAEPEVAVQPEAARQPVV